MVHKHVWLYWWCEFIANASHLDPGSDPGLLLLLRFIFPRFPLLPLSDFYFLAPSPYIFLYFAHYPHSLCPLVAQICSWYLLSNLNFFPHDGNGANSGPLYTGCHLVQKQFTNFVILKVTLYIQWKVYQMVKLAEFSILDGSVKRSWINFTCSGLIYITDAVVLQTLWDFALPSNS